MKLLKEQKIQYCVNRCLKVVVPMATCSIRPRYRIENMSEVIRLTFLLSVKTPCSGDPCGLNGACSYSGSTYVCNCNVGYVGTNCENSM